MSAQTIFEQLRKAGCTVTGALALMGNWQCESNLEACRVQGDFTSDRAKSKAFATRIDNGLVSDEEAAHTGLGWGLAQWTYPSRVLALIQFCRRRSISIANETAQVDFAIQELKTSYASVWSLLTKAEESDLYTAVDLVCKRYEAPAFNNTQARYNAACMLRNDLQAKATEEIDNSVAAETFWPPRVLCRGMRGPDVSALQALLLAHGYNPGGVTGIFNAGTESMTKAYQKARGLDVDGVAGPQTWTDLLRR